MGKKGKHISSKLEVMNNNDDYLMAMQEVFINHLISTNNEDEQIQVCAYFGCGKKLSLREQLCGKYCIEHIDTKPLDVTMVLKFK